MCDQLEWTITATWYGDSNTWAAYAIPVDDSHARSSIVDPQQFLPGSSLEQTLVSLLYELGCFEPIHARRAQG